jgi:hypothetical protein
MERVNNTIRGREKGLKADATPMLPLFVAYYNLIREHQAIDKTPAKAAGVDLDYPTINGGKIRLWER